jgi:hypothetical protein
MWPHPEGDSSGYYLQNPQAELVKFAAEYERLPVPLG